MPWRAKFLPKPSLAAPGLTGARDPHRFEQPDYIRALLAAASRSVHLGISVMDAQTRFESVNAALARETRAPVDQHIGKTTREIVGDIARQIEPTYEKVLRTGTPAYVWTAGRVRDTLEFGYWFDYCFPIFDQSARVQQLGLLVLNVTAEKAITEIFDALTLDSKFLSMYPSGMLQALDEAIRRYHAVMRRSFEELSSPNLEGPRKAAHFQSSLQQLDVSVRLMRDVITAAIAQFPIPRC